jgi:UDP-glucuronate decarboxylase
MLGLAKRLRARILQASTSKVYGDPITHPQNEDYGGNVNPIGPRSCYDEGKRCAETLFFDYRRQHRLSIKVARIFNNYGPRMHPNAGRVYRILSFRRCVDTASRFMATACGRARSATSMT